MNTLLRKKIFLGYAIIAVVVLFMAFVMLNERFRFREFGNVINETNHARKNIYKAHLYITKLATLGESVITWNESDYEEYHRQLLKTDSILLETKSVCKDFVRPAQIDSLRLLLETKEAHLFQIMKAVRSMEKTDSLLARELPVIVRRTKRMKTVTRKKSGIAGLFGKKETVQVPYYTDEIQDFNERLTSAKDRHNNRMETYADSLRLQNRLLNHKLYDLASFLDSQIQQSFADRSMRIVETRQESFRLFIAMMCFAVILIVTSFLIIQFDLRKEEKIKLKLQHAVRENEELLAMRKKIILTVSHDIRGPIGNIRNCADLASETREKKKREAYLEDIRYSCHHILHLVNDLMDAYRLHEAGDLRNDTPFPLNLFLQRISDEFSRKANVKALIFYTLHDNSDHTVKGDADKLEQVLANLLTNAFKFTPSGYINFHSEYSDGKLRVEIRDTGIGMDEETQKRIFTPFERAAQNVNSEGFGLGLFLTKGLVKVLDGTVEVESEPGKGSVFRLEIPLPETDEFVEKDKPDIKPVTTLPEKVLVVDDDPIQLKIAEDMLSRKGIACTPCMNLREAVAALGKTDYDMVLTDIQMPDTDGFGLLKLLRNSDIGNSRTVPVAVMTARGDGKTGIYEKEGFAGCIHKPFNIHGLLAFLSAVMSRTRSPGSGGFDFSRLLENTEDNGHMLSLIIKESGKELEELETAVKTADRDAMRKTVHRMMPVWELLGKERLLRELQKILHDKESKDETVREYALEVMEWLGKLIKEAENKQKKHENPDC